MPNAMEEMAAQTLGEAKALKARVAGLAGIFVKLAEEHGATSLLMKRLANSSDSTERADLFPAIRRELLSHEQAELDELYPILREHEETRAIAEEHEREASEMRQLIEELHNDDPDCCDWDSRFERLVRYVEDHAAEEEKSFFPQAQEVLGEEAAKDLEHPYLARKGEVMDELT